MHNHGVTFHEVISQLFPWFPVRTCACTQTSCICAVVTRGVSDELVTETAFCQIPALSLVTVSDVTSNQCWQLTAFIWSTLHTEIMFGIKRGNNNTRRSWRVINSREEGRLGDRGRIQAKKIACIRKTQDCQHTWNIKQELITRVIITVEQGHVIIIICTNQSSSLTPASCVCASPPETFRVLWISALCSRALALSAAMLLERSSSELGPSRLGHSADLWATQPPVCGHGCLFSRACRLSQRSPSEPSTWSLRGALAASDASSPGSRWGLESWPCSFSWRLNFARRFWNHTYKEKEDY